MAKHKKQKIWRLIYPDKTERLTNYDPVLFEKEKLKDAVEKLSKTDIKFVDNTCKRLVIKELLKALEEK